jgi:hypothetical protein
MAQSNKQDFYNSPVAWFVMLERARLDRNFEVAAKAQRELVRLGVSVKYHKSKQGKAKDE